MAYSREEQETCLVFDPVKGTWNVYSNVPKHIRKLSKITELFTIEEEDGKPICVKGVLTEKQVGMRAERMMSDEQKRAAAERLAEARDKKDGAQ
ncbi:hypothetical protein [Neobacillus niacini]|uniref:hypothetical protein n=1 Tax=Neobacillus niacini TaxID=86668 RepID=UPI0021CB47CC|nr:hypothetical protein [Neobacillus niacini]MCM3763477.1 hypothetical protein [Neobacillus niacini]